jgi:hypothetical protein
MQNVNVAGKSQQDTQLSYNAAELKNVMKTITLRFVQLLKKNKLLAVEILFEFPTREIKDQILRNYEDDGSSTNAKVGDSSRQAHNNPQRETAEELPIDFDNFGEVEGDKMDHQEAHQQDEAKDDEGQAGHESMQWTQAMDEILISNYKNFDSLGPRSCFELLSALIPGTTAKQCYKRGKLLKLQKKSEQAARD